MGRVFTAQNNLGVRHHERTVTSAVRWLLVRAARRRLYCACARNATIYGRIRRERGELYLR
jgi:hypothetical protein